MARLTFWSARTEQIELREAAACPIVAMKEANLATASLPPSDLYLYTLPSACCCCCCCLRAHRRVVIWERAQKNRKKGGKKREDEGYMG